MKRINTILYTLLLVVLCVSLYTNFEQNDRLNHAEAAFGYYDDSIVSFEKALVEYEELVEQNQRTINDFERKQSFRNINQELDNINDGVDCLGTITDKDNEISDLKQQPDTETVVPEKSGGFKIENFDRDLETSHVIVRDIICDKYENDEKFDEYCGRQIDVRQKTC